MTIGQHDPCKKMVTMGQKGLKESRDEDSDSVGRLRQVHKRFSIIDLLAWGFQDHPHVPCLTTWTHNMQYVFVLTAKIYYNGTVRICHWTSKRKRWKWSQVESGEIHTQGSNAFSHSLAGS